MRLLAVGHVTWDRREGGDVLGGSVTYGALTARKLGWEAAILTSAGPDFVPERDLPGVEVFCHPASATTRFTNLSELLELLPHRWQLPRIVAAPVSVAASAPVPATS